MGPIFSVFSSIIILWHALVQLTGATHWCNLLVQLTGATHWCNSLVQLTGATHWCNSLVQLTGATHWCNSLVQLTGATHWCNSLVQLTGATHWCNSLVQLTGATHWCNSVAARYRLTSVSDRDNILARGMQAHEGTNLALIQILPVQKVMRSPTGNLSLNFATTTFSYSSYRRLQCPKYYNPFSLFTLLSRTCNGTFTTLTCFGVEPQSL